MGALLDTHQSERRSMVDSIEEFFERGIRFGYSCGVHESQGGLLDELQ